MDSIAKRVESDIRSGVKPADDYTEAMLAYWQYCTSGSATQDCKIAFDIRKDETQREILEALILSGCPDDDIQEAFRVPLSSIRTYRELFFDPARFPTRLSVISYLEHYPNEFGRSLKMRAMNIGYEYVLYTYANIMPKTKAQKELVERMFMTSAYKAMNINFCGITSATAKQALEHGKLMLKTYEALQKLGNDDLDASYDLSRILLSKNDSGEAPRPAPEEII